MMGELGVGGETARQEHDGFQGRPAKIATCPELKGTLGYVRTSPFSYPELDELPRKWNQRHRVRQAVAVQLKEQLKTSRRARRSQEDGQLVKEVGDSKKALEKDTEYQQAKQESDRNVCNWYCHYQGSGPECTAWSDTSRPRR